MDKTTLRRQVLAATKAVSKESRNHQSTRLSQRILSHIDTHYLSTSSSQQQQSNYAARPIIVCSFLPMYFEPDLHGVLKGLWERRGRNANTPNYIRTVVPHMISSSEMLFVEVKNEEDLNAAFAPQGKWNIVELLPNVLKNSLEGKDDGRVVIGAPVGGGVPTSSSEQQQNPPSLDISKFLIQEKNKLCGGASPSSASAPTSYDMVLLCPVAALDLEGRRLGKGAGFYDRFISGVNTSLKLSSSNEHHQEGTAVLPSRCELVGVGLEEQRVEGGIIPMDEHDQWLHTVITPSTTTVLKEKFQK